MFIAEWVVGGPPLYPGEDSDAKIRIPWVSSSGSPDKGFHLQGGQDNFYVAWVFALELKLSKTLSGLVYFVLQL